MSQDPVPPPLDAWLTTDAVRREWQRYLSGWLQPPLTSRHAATTIAGTHHPPVSRGESGDRDGLVDHCCYAHDSHLHSLHCAGSRRREHARAAAVQVGMRHPEGGFRGSGWSRGGHVQRAHVAAGRVEPGGQGALPEYLQQRGLVVRGWKDVDPRDPAGAVGRPAYGRLRGTQGPDVGHRRGREPAALPE